jgi:hypothetical protein
MRPRYYLNHIWDPVAALLVVALKFSRLILILASLCVVLWQVYDVTKMYLSCPVSTELQVVPLNDMPNIHMSICKRYEIIDCKFFCQIKNKCRECNPQQITPEFFNLNENWYMNMTSYRFRDWIDYIKVWNDALAQWNVVYDRLTFSLDEEEVMFKRQMYPYFGNFTLLCYTFMEDVRTLSPMIKLQRRGDEKF